MWCIPQDRCATTSPAWRISSISMPSRMTHSDQWSASTKDRSSSSARCAAHPAETRKVDTATIPSTNVTARPTSFHVVDANRSWRKVKVTAGAPTRTSPSACATWPTSTIPTPTSIRVVIDNLSTHTACAVYQTFPAERGARGCLRRFEFHYTPRHASWLNIVEIEIGVIAGQCLDRRIESYPRLIAEVAAWEKQRNAARARIDWSFTTEKPPPKWASLSEAHKPKTAAKKLKPLCRGLAYQPSPITLSGRPAHRPFRDPMRPW